MSDKALKDFSHHILDIAINGVEANATMINIEVTENNGSLSFTVSDNGHGMDSETLSKAVKHGFSTKKSGGSGFGLPVLIETVAAQGGDFSINSEIGKGTTVKVNLKKSSLLLGNMPDTLMVLIAIANADIVYTHTCNGKTIAFRSSELQTAISAPGLCSPETAIYAREYLEKRLLQIKQ